METIIKTTSMGTMEGIQDGDILTFKGIPYAETKRFQPPVMIEHYDGVLDCTKEEQDCYQFNYFRDPSQDFYFQEFTSGKECTHVESPMTLTITTVKDKEKLPVLIFIHGGGFETGYVGELPFGGCQEYAKRDIILVSVGYRLNVFSLYENGNYGHLDQKCAVDWIYKHIEEFGGDPNRMTLMGQSAGAMSIMNLTYNKNTLGNKIKGIITMSGGGVMPKMAKPLSKEEAAVFWEGVRKRIPATKEEMYTLPVDVIWNAWYDESRANYSPRNVVPGIDGEIIPDVPQNIVKKGEDLDVPMMIGVTSQDFMAPILHLMAMNYAKRNNKMHRSHVYGYFFDRTLPGNRFKAFHAADLWYMFGNMKHSWRPFEKVDYDLSKQMIDYVANFVKTQNPNGEGLPNWPYISKENRAYRHLDGVSEGTISALKAFRKTVYTFTKDKGPM